MSQQKLSLAHTLAQQETLLHPGPACAVKQSPALPPQAVQMRFERSAQL